MLNKISACLVVYNEEDVIERCLLSLKNLVDEIIVVHDGECNDNTLVIAKRYGAKVFVREHGGRCEFHRIFSFEQASNAWILMIDADEYFSEKNVKKIKKMMIKPNAEAFAFKWPVYNGQQYVRGVYGEKTKTVLASREMMYYIAITHESLATYGTLRIRKDITLEHKPLTNSFTFNALRKKLFIWGNIQAQEIIHIENAFLYNIPDKNSNPHYMYYIAFRAHPLFMSMKLILYDMYQTGIKEKLFISPPENWKIFLIKIINYAYLGYRVKKDRKHL